MAAIIVAGTLTAGIGVAAAAPASAAGRLAANDSQAPLQPTNLAIDGFACDGPPHPISGGSGNSLGEAVLSAVVTNPSGYAVSAQFVWWPADHPDQRTETDAPLSGSGTVLKASLLTSQLVDGTTYSWYVRGVNGQNVAGPWSRTCQFTAELTPPTVAPTMSSAVYPPNAGPTGTGGSGVTGSFTFTANGVDDVVAFAYGVSGAYRYVAADHRGGSATIQLTPSTVGPGELDVYSIDGAGNASPLTGYQFFVADNTPAVSCTPATGYLGQPRQCRFTPRGAGTVVGYSYSFHGSPTTVAAGQDGSATVTIVPTSTDGPFYELSVAAELAGGTSTQATQLRLSVDPADPVITQAPDQPFVGTPVQFTFHPALPGLVSYTYVWDGGAPVTVPAGPDGTATVTLASANGFVELDVFSTSGTGIVSGTTVDYVSQNSNQPAVTSSVYPAYGAGGGVGVPGTFTFSSPVPGAVGYTYSLDGGAPVTVAAGADGTASVVLTPTTTGLHDLVVTSTLADGTASDSHDYSFSVAG